MKYLLELCFVAITLTVYPTTSASAQSQPNPAIPTLRKGISVELPIASSSVQVPKADKLNALVVTVTRNGTLYVGVNPINTTDLPDKLKDALSTQSDKTVYIKADSRAPYEDLVKILDSVRMAGGEAVTFLTNQREQAEPRTPVTPTGLEMRVVATRPGDRSSSSRY
jgi:biopolymer transport protein TolR